MLSDWPGNVRQLASELFRLVASVEDGDEITPELLTADSVHLSKSVTGDGNARSASSISVDLTLPLRVVVEQVERVAISRALEVSGGDLAATAGLLGLSRKGLYLKRQRLGL
jgi:DNA-binding NtrC family response regulator